MKPNALQKISVISSLGPVSVKYLSTFLKLSRYLSPSSKGLGGGGDTYMLKVKHMMKCLAESERLL